MKDSGLSMLLVLRICNTYGMHYPAKLCKLFEKFKADNYSLELFSLRAHNNLSY